MCQWSSAMGLKNTLIFLVLTQIVRSDEPYYLAKKCCRQGESFYEDGCVMSNHRWFYTGFLGFGIPECNYTVNFAEQGSKAFCFDNEYETDSFVMINCGNDTFEIPPMNYIRKCCPLNRIYDSAEQSCWGSESFEREWPNEFFNVFVAGSRGAVDINVGQQKCAENYVLVDFVVHHSRVFRDESEAIVIKDTSLRFNPDEVCLDLTQVVEEVIIRACLPSESVCKERICVRKCCQDGFSIKDGQCVQTNRSLPHLNITTLIQKPAFYFGNVCSDVDSDLKKFNFWLLPNGTLTNGEQLFQNYCIDSFTNHELYYSICNLVENNAIEITFNLKFISLIISSFFFISSIIIQITQNLKNTLNKCVLIYLIFLSTESFCTLLFQFEYFIRTKDMCQILAYGSQISILGAYMTLNLLIFNNWITFRKPMRRKRLPFSGFILVFLLFVLIIYFLANEVELKVKVNFEKQKCFTTDFVHLFFIFMLKFLILLSNKLMIAKTLLICASASQKSALRGKTYQRDKEKLIIGLFLSSALLMIWISELLFYLEIISRLIFTIINYVFHSFLIFLIISTSKLSKNNCNKSEISVISNEKY